MENRRYAPSSFLESRTYAPIPVTIPYIKQSGRFCDIVTRISAYATKYMSTTSCNDNRWSHHRRDPTDAFRKRDHALHTDGVTAVPNSIPVRRRIMLVV